MTLRTPARGAADPFAAILAQALGGGQSAAELREGYLRIGHHNAEMEGYAIGGKFDMAMFFTHVTKTPGERGGWRWHKWGTYVGRGTPTTEYLDDEAEFADGIECFHIFDVVHS